jgi:hypothetical protein
MNRRSLIAAALIAIGTASCAIMPQPTGEPGISMGDSYEKVLSVIEKRDKITLVKEGEEIQAVGYSALMRDCREKKFRFQGKDGLQWVTLKPAQNLQNELTCR